MYALRFHAGQYGEPGFTTYDSLQEAPKNLSFKSLADWCQEQGIRLSDEKVRWGIYGPDQTGLVEVLAKRASSGEVQFRMLIVQGELDSHNNVDKAKKLYDAIKPHFPSNSIELIIPENAHDRP